MKTRCLALVLLPVILACATTFAQEFVNIGKLKVSADSPLARGEYPRLMITRAQLPAIRARLKHPEIQKYLQQARDLIRKGEPQHNCFPLLTAVLYQMTGEKQYAEMAKQNLGDPTLLPEWVFRFDLVAETMTEAERQDYARRMLATIKAYHGARSRLLLALAAWGNGLDDELVSTIEAGYAGRVVGRLARNNRWSLGRGGSNMGHGYNGSWYFSYPAANMIGWSHATGDDVLARCDFAHQQPAWYIYHYLPWEKRRRVLRVGVTAVTGGPGTLTPASFQGETPVMLAITQTRNGLGQWWQREFIGNWPMSAWRKGQEHVYGLSGRLLWLDPSIPSIPPAKFPETRLFLENGHVCMRSDWTEDATVALFRCGRHGEIGLRSNADNLHFIIYREGHLAPDTGCVHYVNEVEWKMPPRPGSRDYSDRSNVLNYGRQTIAHNSITVGRESVRNHSSNPSAFSHRGGQTPLHKNDWFKEWGAEPEGGRRGWPRYRKGDIVAYQTSTEFDYACGDATHSYPPSRVTSITRQFVYLKPDTFVVFDRVRAADPDLEVIWNFHALKGPAWNGKRAPDPAWPPQKQFIVGPDGKKLPNPHPGGHFLHTGGDAFRITDADGELDLKLLLPAAEERIVRTIGGPWHDFEINGVNYGPNEESYKVKRGQRSIGVGGWRIEVAPKEVNGEVHFLHVLHVGPKGAFQPAESELVRRKDRLGAKVQARGRTFEVTFNASGPTGGHIKISEGNRTLIDEDLVTQVEDNYDHWKTDPRYEEWMTNEFMRAVIFPYGKKPE